MNIYISIYILWVFNKNYHNWSSQCVSWINSNLHRAKIYLVFLKIKNRYIKVEIKYW